MPGNTVDLVIPYAIPSDPLAEWPAVNQSMSEKIEALLRGVQFATSDGLSGDGSIAAPLKVLTSGTWGTAPLAMPPYAASNQDLGDEVYLDSAGLLRVRPQLLWRTLVGTALPSAYPAGHSILSVGPENGTGWPSAAGSVATIKRQEVAAGQANGQAQQWWYRNNSGEVLYRWAASDLGGWSTWLQMSEPANLPVPVDTYNAADQTITATARVTESPTQVRCQVINPHPSKRMLCRVVNNPWMAVTPAAGSSLTGYVDVKTVSGGTGAIPASAQVVNVPAGVVSAYVGTIAENHVWVAPGATLVIGVGASRGGTGGTVIIRYVHSQIVPIRYE